jgi:hypothetical protein
MKRGRGRPIVLNAALQRRITALLRKGSTFKSAAILCGVSERAFHSWMERGKQNEQPYKRFFDAASRAREQHKANLIAVVREAAHKDARHAEWLLERQFPHEFAPYDRRPIPVEPEPEKKRINVAFVVETKGKSLEEVANFPVLTTQQAMPEPEPERELPERTWDGDISRLGRCEYDLPLDGNVA